jgi:hypothetical protein
MFIANMRAIFNFWKFPKIKLFFNYFIKLGYFVSLILKGILYVIFVKPKIVKRSYPGGILEEVNTDEIKYNTIYLNR